MWLRVLISRKVVIYSDGDNIIIIIIIIGFFGWRFKLVLLVLLWLSWYFVGSYPLAKCWWKIKVVEKNEDVVRFLKEGFNGSMKYKGLHWYAARSRSKERT